MTTTISSTELDFNNIKTSLKNFLAAKEEFNDYNFEGAGLNNILDVLAYNTHYNGLIANFALNESYLSTAQMRSSLVSIAEGIGYIPKSKVAAFASVKLSVNVGTLANRPVTLSLPSGTKFTSVVDDITYTFQTTQTVTGTDNGYGLYQMLTIDGSDKITIKEGSAKIKTFFVGADSLDDVYVIPDKSIDTETAVVKVFESPSDTAFTSYININKATQIDENSRLYIMKEAPNGFYELTFGDGNTLGKTPIAGNKVTIEYLQVKGAAANNATSFTAVNTVTPIVGGASFNVDVLTNIKSIGGDKVESLASIRKNAPFQYAAQNRMVTAVDYSTLVLKNFGTLIKDIQAFGGQDALKPEFGVVFLSIAFNDDVSADAIAATKISILDLTKQLSVVGFGVKFEDPVKTFVETEVFFQFNPKLTALSINNIQDTIQNKVAGYFTSNVGKFGQSFRRSNMLSLIDEVDTAVLSSRANIKLQQRMIPNLDILEDTTLRFPATIAEPDDKLHIITSSSFQYQGEVCVIRNKLNTTKLEILALSSQNILNDNVGSYQASTATVSIVGLLVEEIIGGTNYIKIKATPANQSAISPIRNDILEYDAGPSFSQGVVVTST